MIQTLFGKWTDPRDMWTEVELAVHLLIAIQSASCVVQGVLFCSSGFMPAVRRGLCSVCLIKLSQNFQKQVEELSKGLWKGGRPVCCD